MTDAENLRAELLAAIHHALPNGAIPILAEVLSVLPPIETLAALKAETWRAIPAKPTEEMLNRGVDWILQGHMTETYQDDLKEAYTTMLAAAPAKPEG